MAEAFDPDDVEKFFPAIAAAARGVAAVGAKAAKKVAQSGAAAAGKVAQGGAAAAGKVKEGVGAAATKVKEAGTAAAGKVNEVADKAKNITPEQKKKLGAAVGVMQQMDQRRMQAEQQKREQHQRASEMARSAASTGTGIGKSDEAFEIDYSQPSHLETGTFKPDDMCQLCKERPAQYKTGYSARGRPHSPIQYNLCESCFDSFSHGGNMATYSRFIKGGPMDLAWRLLKEEVLGSDQHASTGDPRFWDIMRHYGYYDPHAVNQAFEPYPLQQMSELTPHVDELLASYGYEPYYFGGRYPMPDLNKRNYESGHLAIYDPEVRTAGFSDAAFTDNWRKLHELGHALGLEDINAKWGEGRRLGKLGVRTPREMLRAVDWERAAMENQRDLMNEVGLQITPEAQYNKDWNTTIGDAAFRAITGKFTSPETEGFVPFSEKIPLDIAMRKVRERADELGLDMDETLRDKRGGARKIASEPMDLAWRLLKQQTFNDYFGVKDQWISLPKEGMDERPELYGEVAEAMNIAYAPIGGHAKYKNADDLRGEGKHARYDLIDNDEDPYVDAAHIFQDTEHGFKSSVLGQDGSRTGRRAVVGHAVEAMNTPGHFMEASGPMAAVLERNQVGVVESPEMIQRVLAGKDIRMHPDGGGVYTRTIGDEEHDKRIFGQPLESAVAVTQPYMEQVYDQQSMTNPFDLFGKSEVLVKERKTPEAMRHKREYDAAYNKRPDQVKYREELNRERRRRGIMGSHDHMDVSHTQGGKLTLEPEHSNRARHFREKGTLRVMKSMRDDLELLRNLMQGPMDEQDKKIATAMVGMLEERHGDDEEEEDELLRPMFGGGDLFV